LREANHVDYDGLGILARDLGQFLQLVLLAIDFDAQCVDGTAGGSQRQVLHKVLLHLHHGLLHLAIQAIEIEDLAQLLLIDFHFARLSLAAFFLLFVLALCIIARHL